MREFVIERKGKEIRVMPFIDDKNEVVLRVSYEGITEEFRNLNEVLFSFTEKDKKVYVLCMPYSIIEDKLKADLNVKSKRLYLGLSEDLYSEIKQAISDLEKSAQEKRIAILREKLKKGIDIVFEQEVNTYDGTPMRLERWKVRETEEVKAMLRDGLVSEADLNRLFIYAKEKGLAKEEIEVIKYWDLERLNYRVLLTDRLLENVKNWLSPEEKESLLKKLRIAKWLLKKENELKLLKDIFVEKVYITENFEYASYDDPADRYARECIKAEYEKSVKEIAKRRGISLRRLCVERRGGEDVYIEADEELLRLLAQERADLVEEKKKALRQEIENIEERLRKAELADRAENLQDQDTRIQELKRLLSDEELLLKELFTAKVKVTKDNRFANENPSEESYEREHIKSPYWQDIKDIADKTFQVKSEKTGKVYTYYEPTQKVLNFLADKYSELIEEKKRELQEELNNLEGPSFSMGMSP